MSGRPADELDPVDVRLVPAALTCWLVTAVGVLWPVGVPLTAAFTIATAVALAVRRRLPAAAGLLAVCVIGAGFGLAITLRVNGVRDHPLTTRFGTVAEVTVTPSESPRSVGRGRLLFRGDLSMLDSDEIHGRVTIFASAMPFSEAAAGRPMRFKARIARPQRRDLTVATLTATGEPAMGTMSSAQRLAGDVRNGFAVAAHNTLSADRAAMLRALVLGDTATVSETMAAQFRDAGLTHLTAVSGANVTIVCATVLFVAGVVGPRFAVGLAAVALAAFVIVVQPTASVLRAAVMGSIALLAVLTSRRRQAIPALAATVLVLMSVAPQLAVDVGFALSVSATAALVMIAPAWSRKLVGRGWPKPAADAVCVAAAAQLVTAPLVAGISGRLSLVAVGANLAAIPVIAPITVLGTAAAALSACWPGAAHLLIRFTGPELWWLQSVSGWAAGTPGATVPVPAGVLGTVVIALAGVAIAIVARTRWRWAALVIGGGCALAWSLSEWFAGPA